MSFVLIPEWSMMNLLQGNCSLDPCKWLMVALYFYSYSEPPELFYGGEVVGESKIKYEDEIGGQVVHSYEVRTGRRRMCLFCNAFSGSEILKVQLFL